MANKKDDKQTVEDKDKEKQIEIVLLPPEDEKPVDNAAAQEKKPETKKPEDKQPTPEEAMVELREKLEKSEKDRLAAQTRADSLAREKEQESSKVVSAEAGRLKAQEDAIDGALTAAKSELDTAKRDLRAALEVGDNDQVVELQEKIADARWKMKGAENAKGQIEAYKKKLAETPASTGDTYTPAAKRWIDSHPKFTTDNHYKKVAIRAHEDAVDDGIETDSTAYFRYIEERLAEAGLEEKTVTESKERKAGATSTAAPPSRDNGTSNQSTNAREIRLTASQREAAKICGMTDLEYATQLYEEQQAKRSA